MTSSKGNIFRVTDPLCVEFTGHRWITCTKASDAELCITSLTNVFSTVYSDADPWKYQSSASLALVRGIHWSLVNSPYKWPVTRKMFPFDDVIMQSYNAAQYREITASAHSHSGNGITSESQLLSDPIRHSVTWRPITSGDVWRASTWNCNRITSGLDTSQLPRCAGEFMTLLSNSYGVLRWLKLELKKKTAWFPLQNKYRHARKWK